MIWVSTSVAQLHRDSLVTRPLLLNDLDSLKKTILDSHPSPFAFCGESAFEEAYQEACNALNSLTSIRDFAHIVSKFIGVMKDSHSTLDYGQLLELSFSVPNSYLVPFSVYKESNSTNFYVVSDWQDVMPKGGQLISINGVDVNKLFAIAMEYACIEGSAHTAQQAIATTLLPYINTLYNPCDSINSFELIPPGANQPKTYELAGYTQSQFKEARKERNKRKENHWVETQYNDSLSLAILRVSTFSPPSSIAFRKHIKKTFKTLHKRHYQNLIIDLRGNGGGSSSWVEYLYSFIDSTGYNTPNNVIGKNSQLALTRAKGMDGAFANMFMWLFYRNNEDVQSFRQLRKLPLGDMDTVYFKDPVIQKGSNIFAGNAYLLINGRSASASVDFTNTFLQRKRGQIIGEPCLGPTTGTWGNPTRYKLPNSQLAVTIATIRYNYDNTFVYIQQPIQPHKLVPTSPQDLATGKDTQVEFVKALIESK